MKKTPEIIRADVFFKNNLRGYTQTITQLLETLSQDEPTLVIHTPEEFRDRFHHSMIVVADNQCVGHSSLYPTQMKPLNEVLVREDGHTYQVGELGSVAIDKDYQHQGLGKLLLQKTLEEFENHYGAIISATINPNFTKLATKLGFSEEDCFPQEYYNEGKIHLGPLLPGGIPEFEQRAKFFVLAHSEQYLKDILDHIRTYDTATTYSY